MRKTLVVIAISIVTLVIVVIMTPSIIGSIASDANNSQATPSHSLPPSGHAAPNYSLPPSQGSTMLQQTCGIESGGLDDEGALGDNPPNYVVTLTNNTGQIVNINSVTTVFFLGGTEQTSDDEEATGTIVIGQSLSWTFTIPQQLDAIESDGMDSGGNPLYILNLNLSCRVVQYG